MPEPRKRVIRRRKEPVEDSAESDTEDTEKEAPKEQEASNSRVPRQNKTMRRPLGAPTIKITRRMRF